MRQCGRVLVVFAMVVIMAGGILLADNSMRELQGREKRHLPFNGKVIIPSQIKKNCQRVSADGIRMGFRSWCDLLKDRSKDMIKGVRETAGKRCR